MLAAAGFIPCLETRTATLGSTLASALITGAPAPLHVFVTQLGRRGVLSPDPVWELPAAGFTFVLMSNLVVRMSERVLGKDPKCCDFSSD